MCMHTCHVWSDELCVSLCVHVYRSTYTSHALNVCVCVYLYVHTKTQSVSFVYTLENVSMPSVWLGAGGHVGGCTVTNFWGKFCHGAAAGVQSHMIICEYPRKCINFSGGSSFLVSHPQGYQGSGQLCFSGLGLGSPEKGFHHFLQQNSHPSPKCILLL